MFRQWDAQYGGGLRRKAVVGQLHEVTDLLQETLPAADRPAAVPAHRRTRPAGRLDVLRRRAAAQRAEVLRAGAARGQGGRRPPARRATSSPTMSRQMIHLDRRDDALELIHLAQYGSRDTATAAHPGDALRDGGARLRQHSARSTAATARSGWPRTPSPTAARRRTRTGCGSSPRPSCTRRTRTPSATSPTSQAAAPRTPRWPHPVMAHRRRPVPRRHGEPHPLLRPQPGRHGHRPSAAGRSPSRPRVIARGGGGDRRARCAPSGSTPGSARPPAAATTRATATSRRSSRLAELVVGADPRVRGGLSPRRRLRSDGAARYLTGCHGTAEVHVLVTRVFVVTAAKHRAALAETRLRHSPLHRRHPGWHGTGIPGVERLSFTRRRRWPGIRAWQRQAIPRFVLISAALVMLMTPGLAFFYGGMVRVKSVLNMLMMSFIASASSPCCGCSTAISLAFGTDARRTALDRQTSTSASGMRGDRHPTRTLGRRHRSRVPRRSPPSS